MSNKLPKCKWRRCSTARCTMTPLYSSVVSFGNPFFVPSRWQCTGAVDKSCLDIWQKFPFPPGANFTQNVCKSQIILLPYHYHCHHYVLPMPHLLILATPLYFVTSAPALSSKHATRCGAIIVAHNSRKNDFLDSWTGTEFTEMLKIEHVGCTLFPPEYKFSRHLFPLQLCPFCLPLRNCNEHWQLSRF